MLTALRIDPINSIPDKRRNECCFGKSVLAVRDEDVVDRGAVLATARIHVPYGDILQAENVRLAQLTRTTLNKFGNVVELLDAVSRFDLRLGVRRTEKWAIIVCEHDPAAQRDEDFESTACSAISRVISAFSIFVFPYAQSMR